MLLAIQLALIVVGVVVAVRGRMSGARGREVIGSRARLAGLVLLGMSAWSVTGGTMMGHVPEGMQRLSVVGMQGVWLLGAMIMASMIAGAGRPAEAVRRGEAHPRRAAA